RVVLVEVGSCIPGFKSMCTGACRLSITNRSKVPFPKKTSLISMTFQNIRDRLLLGTQGMTPIKYAHPGWIPSRQKACTGGRTDRCAVMPIKSQAGPCHLIEIGGDNRVVAHIAHIAVSLVVGNYDNEIGTLCR